MGSGISIFLMAVGAVLTFAIDADWGGVDVNTVGWILMVVGALGLLLAAVGLVRGPRRRRVIHDVVDR